MLGNIYSDGKGNVKQDFKLAAKYVQMHIARGETSNLRRLAEMYRDGKGVEVDLDKAIELYRRATTDNQKLAYHNLGYIYNSDTLGKKDNDKAIHYFTKGAEANEKYALNALGDIYNKGEIVEKDTAIAIKLYKKAAKQNLKDSQFNLAEIYEKGTGETKVDLEEAIKFYQAAAKQKYEPAIEALKRLGVK